MATTKKDEKPGNIIMLALASGNGLVSTNFWLADTYMAPMNTTMARGCVKGKTVDAARNELVEHARSIGASYIFYVDDDVLVPHFAIIRLHGLKTGVATGVYYTKSQPSTPVLLMKGQPAGFEDWKQGDVIKVDYCGAGCLLVKMEVFDAIEKKYPGEPYFFYNRGRTDVIEEEGYVGEDVWFCKRATECGYPIMCDTGVQCGHEDAAHGLIYKYDRRYGLGIWKFDGTNKIGYLPTAEMAMNESAKKEYIGGQICWGYGDGEDFTEADVGSAAEIKGKFSGVEAVKIRRFIEFRTNEESVGILRAICTVMVPAAEIEVRVPDIVKAIKEIDDESSQYEIDDVMGTAAGKYKGIYTKAFMLEAMKAAGFSDISVHKKSKSLVVTARKVK